MPILPEDARRELARRELARRELARRQQPESPRARLGLPEDPGHVFAQAGRGLRRSLGSTVEMVKQFGQAARALPLVTVRAAGIGDPDLVAATRRGFVEGAKEVPRAIREAPLQTLAGLEEGLTPVEQGAKIVSDIGQALLLRRVPGVRAVRRGRAARKGAGEILARRQPSIGPERQLGPGPADVVQAAERRATAQAWAPRVATQEAADVTAGQRFGTPVRPPDRPGRLGGRAPMLEDELQKALAATRTPERPARVSAQPPRFGQRPSAEQPRITISREAERRLAAQGRRVPTEQELAAQLAKVQAAARRATRGDVLTGPPSAAEGAARQVGPVPKFRVAAPEVRAVSEARAALQKKAGGPIPKGMQTQIDRLRVEYNRTQAETKRLRSAIKAGDTQVDPRAAQQFEQAARELGSRLSETERTAVRLARAARGEGGRISTGALLTTGGVGAGAVVGGAIGSDKSERIANAITGGLGGLAVVRGVRKMTPAIRTKIGDQALNLRREVFLSGAALPKNLSTALGSLAIAAGETSGAQAKQLLKQYPSLIRDLGKALVKPRDIIPLEAGRGATGPFARRIGAVDKAAENALKRGGVTDQAQLDRALVKTPLRETLGEGAALQFLQSKPGQFVVPFQRTPFDIAVGGATEVAEAVPKFMGAGKPVRGALGTAGRRKAITAGAAGAGAGAGASLKDDKLALLKFGMLASLFGRRAVPFALGGAAAAGPRFLSGVSPTPEFALDPRNMIPTEPRDIGLLRLWEQLSRGQ